LPGGFDNHSFNLYNRKALQGFSATAFLQSETATPVLPIGPYQQQYQGKRTNKTKANPIAISMKYH